MHRGLDIATDELGREVDHQSTLKVPLPCLAHIYIVTSLVWSLGGHHIHFHTPMDWTLLPTNDPDFFWIGPHPDFGPFIHSFGSDIQRNLRSNLYALGSDILQHMPGVAMCTIVWMHKTNHQIAIKLSTLDPSEQSEAWLTCLMVSARLCIAATTAVFNSVFGSQRMEGSVQVSSGLHSFEWFYRVFSI
jgi:hypothetical protein